MKHFKIDFGNLNLLELKALGILPQDIQNLLTTDNTAFHNADGFSYAIGYMQGMFIHFAYSISKNVNFDIELLQAGIPNEEDIKRYWCQRKKG